MKKLILLLLISTTLAAEEQQLICGYAEEYKDIECMGMMLDQIFYGQPAFATDRDQILDELRADARDDGKVSIIKFGEYIDKMVDIGEKKYGMVGEDLEDLASRVAFVKKEIEKNYGKMKRNASWKRFIVR